MVTTTVGTDEADILRGRGIDVIDGAGGDDTIRGYAHRDTLLGGEGDDYIVTGTGPDVAHGGPGNDRIIDDYTSGVEILRGGTGDDLIRSLSGAALGPFGERTEWWMFGDDGDDTVMAGEGGIGHLFGGAGEDTLVLNSYGAGEAHGGAGDDRIYSDERQRVNGEADIEGKYAPGGEAIIDGGTGNDRMWGSYPNRDVFVFEEGDGRDVIRNFGDRNIVGDVIDLRSFNLGMTAEEVFDTYGHDQGDRVVLNLGPENTIIIYAAPYDDGSNLVASIIDGLWV